MTQRKKLFSHSTKGIGFGLATLGTGIITILFAGATLGLVISITGIPVAILTGIATAGSAEITYLLYNRTSHHIYHAIHDRHHYLHRPRHNIEQSTQLILSTTMVLSTLNKESFDLKNERCASCPMDLSSIKPFTEEIGVVCQIIDNQETTDSVDNLNVRVS